MKSNHLGAFALAGLAALAAALAPRPAAAGPPLQKVGTPPAGKLYHGVYPGGTTGEEDDVTPADVEAYESAVGQPVAWVYFSNNWYRSRAFPADTAQWIRARGAVPWVRIMLRSTPNQRRSRYEKTFALARVLDGTLDADLRAWADGARDFGTPLVAEVGTECNGDWFPWNGRWNGGKKKARFGDPARYDGPERFAAAFRRVVQIAREEGALNVTWAFHVNWDDGPSKPWNRLEDYYPGDDVVDWIAVSVYGPQTPREKSYDVFRAALDSAYARIQATAPAKPVVLAEFGATAGNPLIAPQDWAGAALDDLLAARWPALVGFSWWNERWENDANPAHDTTMRMQDVPALADAFATKLGAAQDVLQTAPVFVAP